ncbi:MAG: hypothetical protein ACM31L_20175 [Actinomycetota bacterium]
MPNSDKPAHPLGHWHEQRDHFPEVEATAVAEGYSVPADPAAPAAAAASPAEPAAAEAATPAAKPVHHTLDHWHQAVDSTKKG